MYEKIIRRKLVKLIFIKILIIGNKIKPTLHNTAVI